MSELGELLRHTREEKGYSLDDIQETTKIRKRYLEAIEEGDYDILPGSFYVRAFIKSYAEALGLTAETILHDYEAELPKSTGPENESETYTNSKIDFDDRTASERYGKLTVTVLMWLFPILIVVTIYFYWLHHRIEDKNSELKKTPFVSRQVTQSPKPTPSVSVPSSQPVTPSPTEPVAEFKFLKEEQGIRYYEVPANAQLKINVTDKSWVEIRPNNRTGKKLYAQVVPQPQVLVYDLDKPLFVNIGRTDYVSFYLGQNTFDNGDFPGASKYMFVPKAEDNN